MRFEIFAPEKMDVRNGKLRKAIIYAETPEEEVRLYSTVETLSADGWPSPQKKLCDFKNGRCKYCGSSRAEVEATDGLCVRREGNLKDLTAVGERP